jgi:hypothetical protein
MYSKLQATLISRLSDEELDLLEKAQDATEKGRTLTAAESMLVQNLSLALEVECKRAGFRINPRVQGR